MYNTTKNFEKAILGDNRTFRAKIKTGKYETEDGFISIKHYMKSTENSITVGGAVSSYVEVEMWKPDFFIENSELQIFIGIDVEDEDNVLLDIFGEKILDANSNNILTVSSQEKTEWIPLGLFTAQKPKNDNEIVTFTAYDRIESKLSGAYFSDLKYPIDAKKILEEISQKTGVPINISDLPNGVEIAQREVISESDVDEDGNETTTTTYENPFNGYTYREALGYIAMLYCRFAIADRNGTIKLVWYNDTNYEIDTDRYYDDLVTQDEIFLVSKISCTVGDKTIYAGDGTTSISLENPVMTQERLDYIYNAIKELKFLPASTSFYGDIRMDIGDTITLNDKYGNVIKIPLMSVTQEFDGGLLTAIQSYGSGEESTQSGGQITKMVNRTYTELFLVKEIVGTKASFDYVRAKIGEFEELSSNFLKVNDADIKYAKIDLANVNNAWIENGQIKKASITNAEIADATIEAAKIASINADTINSGTLKTKHLIIVSDDGTESIVRVINASNGVPDGEVNSKKIQAASIDVVDLSAFQAKIAGFNLQEYAIYADKQSVTGKDGEIYLSTDRLFMGIGAMDMDLDTPFQAYANGSFRLVGQNSKFDFNSTTGDMDIEVSKLKIASKSVATSDDIDDLMNERTTVLKIESSNGAPLDENSTSTILRVIIYRGRTRITNILDLKKEMGEVSLLWLSRREGEDYKSISANDERISDSGFTFTPSADDIKNRCSFRCRLISDGSGYINPDQATAVDRIEARLQDYVDNILIPSVKNEIISEISKDTYIAKIEKNEKDIAKLQEEISNFDIHKGKHRQVGKARLWYHNFYEFGNTDDEAAVVIAQYDIVVAGGTLYSGKFSDADRDRQLAIIQKAKKLNPELKIFYYITIASWRKDGDWSHILGKGGYWDEEEASKHPGAVRIHTKWEIYQLLEYACHVGGTKNGKKEFIETYTWTDDDGLEHTEDKYIDLYEGGIALDGCFYDDAGMETEEGRVNQGFPAVLREKYIQLVDYTHNKGLIAFPNQMSQDWYADTVSTANPDGLPSAIGENDYMLLESCHSQVGFSGRPLWRHVNNTTNVWNYYQDWYPKVGTKVVVNDYLYGTGTGEKLSDEEFFELATYLVCDTLCSRAHYIDMNGLRTWDLPELFDDLLISDNMEYDITRKDAGHYILHANGHTLEVIRGENLAQGETVSIKTLNKVYIYFDGIRIKNGFKKVPQYAYETDQRLDTVEDELEKIQTSSKSTASIYHRMMIDDWTSEYIYTNFATTTEFIKGIVDKEKTGIATVDSVDYDTNSLRLTRLTNAQIVQFITIDISNKKGHTFEFGWTVNEVTKTSSWGFNTESPATIGWTTIRPAMNNTQKSSLYGENFYGYVKTVIIPEDTEEDTWRLRIVYNGAVGEVFDLSNFYVIDVDEYGEDITKEWYTNLIPTLAGATNNNNLTVCYKLEKLGDYDFNITWNDPDNYANWSGLRWNIPSGSFVPGHTYEFGCETYEHNAGSANVAFRLYYPGANKWIPATLKIKSTIYGDERPGFIFTVPESATTTDGYINFTNTSGKYQNSAGDYIQATIKGMYLYDVNEENIVIRGEEPSNSYMQICRVSKEKLEKDKKLIGNAMYIVDDGTMFVTDFNGKTKDIAGKIFIGATEAGYTGTPEEFGNALYQLIQSNITP